MEKNFTKNLPDENWVAKYTTNRQITYTYKGTGSLYLLINTGSNQINGWSEEPFDPIDYEEKTGNEQIILSADNADELEIMHSFTEHLHTDEYEPIYVEGTNPDGSIYQEITNPLYTEMFRVDYDEGGWIVEPIYKDATMFEEDIARENLNWVNSYLDEYSFTDEQMVMINAYKTRLTEFINEYAGCYPWRFTEIDKEWSARVGAVPKRPIELVSIFQPLTLRMGNYK